VSGGLADIDRERERGEPASGARSALRLYVLAARGNNDDDNNNSANVQQVV
jgi:hypothetical protein